MNYQTLLVLAASSLAYTNASAQNCGSNIVDKLVESPTNSLQQLGSAISVSGDRMLAGAPNGSGHANPEAGSATVYRYENDAWISEGFLQGADILPLDGFGSTVAIDGDRALIGSPADHHSAEIDAGSVYAYRFDGAEWVREHRIWASDADSNDGFGSAIAMSGNLAVIGSPYDDDQGNLSGSAYIYEHDGSGWVFVTKIIPPQVDSFDRFGSAVAIDSGRILITAPVSITEQLYTYENIGSGWTLVDAIDLISLDSSLTNYGNAISVSADHLVIGANQSSTDPVVFNHGGTMVLERDGSSWSYQQTLFPPAPLAMDTFFGNSVAADADSLLIGSGNGTAYLYKDNGGSWMLEQDWQNGSGWAVALSGATVFLGAPGDSTTATAGGAVYVYEVDCMDQCAADFNSDGTLDIFDVFAFLDAFNMDDLAADFTGDGTLDVFDVFDYLDAFEAGCA